MADNNRQRKRISKSSNKSKQAERSVSKKTKAPMRREVKTFITVFCSLVILLSYYTDIFGVFGEIAKNIGLALFGPCGYVLPILISAFIIHNSVKGNVSPYGSIYLAATFILICISMLFTINASEGSADYLASAGAFDSLLLLIQGGTACSDGGVIGVLGIPLKMFFGSLGSKIILIFAVVVLAASLYKFLPVIWLVNGANSLWMIITEKIKSVKEKCAVPSEEDDDSFEEEISGQRVIDFESAPAIESKQEKSSKKAKNKPAALPHNPNEENKPAREKTIGEEKDNMEQEPVKINIVLTNENDFKTSEYTPHIFDEDDSDENKINENLPVENVTVQIPGDKKESNAAIELTDDDFIEDTKPYEFPPISLLEANRDARSASKGPDLREQAKILIDTLKSFGVEAKVLEVNKGPTVTRFEIQPSTGVKVSRITGLSDDIALNLAALSVRIEAPIPGKAAVGIEIPNQGNSIVRLREVIDSGEFKNFGAKTAFALGKNITGTPIVTDIAKMPHVLIAGATGSGKSVCINSLITSILYKADPKEVKFIMIDPKVVELSVYNGIPHLLIPVVTDPRKAAGALNWAVQEMTKRYNMFAENNVRDIKGYNDLAEMSGEKKLEQIIIIVDELADLMMVAPRDVEDAICRLAQMARAAGMHLVIATQRPSVDVITGVIKANVPSRIAFAVSSQIDSRTILDMGGAEKLLGKGDMLFLPMGASKPTRIQGAFISDKEVEKIVEFVKCEDTKYDEDVIEKIESGVSGEKQSDGGDADEYLPQAIEIVVEAGQASASLLQRRLKVGYSRAGRLIDQLEERGIIGPHEGAKPRQVLISRAEYAEMMMQSEN